MIERFRRAGLAPKSTPTRARFRASWRSLAAVFLSIGMLTPMSLAQSPASAPPVEAAAVAPPSLQQIATQQTQLRAQVVAKRGAFKDMSEGDRERLLKQQERLLSLLEGRQSIHELRSEERVEVFNHLQSVSAAVSKAEDERKICERSRLVGTNRFTVVCMTAKQKREHQDGAQKSLRTVMKCEEGCISN